MKYAFLLLIISGINVLLCSAQIAGPTVYNNTISTPAEEGSAVESFQQQLVSAIQRVSPACVLITTEERLTPSGGVMASGVVVSGDGIVMTAGHMVLPGGKYQIIFPDSLRVEATGLGRIGLLDVGLLKITQKGIYPYAILGISSSVKVGEPCFSLAYPGSFSTKLVTRFGQVKEIRNDPHGDIRNQHLRTSCIMEPGDSGGPVFDLAGQVIGIRSYIGMALDENYEVPVDNFKRYWDALLTPISYKEIPKADSIKSVNQKATSWNHMWLVIEKRIHLLEKELDGYCVVVQSSGGNREKTALGTIIDVTSLTDKENVVKHSYVLSKSSEVGSDPKVKIEDRASAAKVIFRDMDNDLVLLQLNIPNLPAVTISDSADDHRASEAIGKLLLSPNPLDDGVLSIFSPPIFEMPGIYNAGYLGARLEMKNGKFIIVSVQPNSAASMASLNIGDVISNIDQVKVEFPADFTTELKKKKAHEVISLVRHRNGIQDTVNIKLHARPFRGINHIADEFTDGRSERRDDFDNVFIHDAKLKPSECGGPIFDLHKNFVGINMARYSRTSSIGLPAREVFDFLRRAFVVELPVELVQL